MADSRNQYLYGALNPSTLDNYGAFQSSGDQTDSRNKPLYGALDPSTKDLYGAAKTYSQLLQSQKDAAEGVSAGSKDEWNSAWKAQQVIQQKNNVPKEDVSDPTPLLIDKISSLPADSPERRSAENLVNTINGTAANVGDGLDCLTRELYKDVKRLAKQSAMIMKGVIGGTLPTADQLLGSEEGLPVSNLEGWKPAFINATRSISDALGSHSDTDHSVIKDACGAAALLPLAVAGFVDNVTSHVVDELEGAFKSVQMGIMEHLPSKLAGSIRQLSTALDDILSVPFEIASDVYNGLMKLIDEISNLIDMAMSKVKEFFIGAGGLLDGLFPEGMFQEIMDTIMDAASEMGELFSLLGGFPAISTITSAVGDISGSLSSVLGNINKLSSILSVGLGIASIVGGLAGGSLGCTNDQIGLFVSKINKGISKINKGIRFAGGILGGLKTIGQGLGNLGAIIGGGISNVIGNLLADVRDLGQIIAQLLPEGIGMILNGLLGKLCGVGIVGNKGFSVGKTMDSLKNKAFSKCMSKYAAHSSIVGPLFGKKTNKIGAYAQAVVVNSFVDSAFVAGAQGNKGVTMIGPGATGFQKVFGLFQGVVNRSSSTYISAPVPYAAQLATYDQISQNLGALDAVYLQQQADASYLDQVAALDALAATRQVISQENRNEVVTPTTIFYDAPVTLNSNVNVVLTN